MLASTTTSTPRKADGEGEPGEGAEFESGLLTPHQWLLMLNSDSFTLFFAGEWIPAVSSSYLQHNCRLESRPIVLRDTFLNPSYQVSTATSKGLCTARSKALGGKLSD